MPPASKKDCSVILFDLKSCEKATSTLLKICCNSFFTESKDLTKLILLNSDTTKNKLTARHGGYDHINEVTDVIEYNPQILLSEIEQSGTAQANWLEGVLVALKNLSQEYENIGGIITYQLLFITDFNQNCDADQDKINDIINGLNQLDAYFYIVGPLTEPPFTINSPKDIQKWMQNLDTKPNKNLEIAKKIADKTKHTVVCDYRVGVNLFFSYRNSGGMQPWNVPLSIGSEIAIPAQTMKFLDEGMLCKLKSVAGRAPVIWVDAEDETVEIDYADTKAGISRHDKFVLMPDNKMFQVQNPRSFNVLCFTSSKNVPEYLMRGEACYNVLPDGGLDNNEAMASLIDCLAEQDKYIIARRIYNANYVPKMVVLVPKPELNPKCFHLISLPFAEDIRFDYKEKDTKYVAEVAIDNDVAKFLNSIDVDDLSCEQRVPLGFTMMLDYNTQNLINKAADKFLEKSLNLDQVDLNYLKKVPSGDGFDRLRNAWETRTFTEVIEKKEKDGQSDDELDWS